MELRARQFFMGDDSGHALKAPLSHFHAAKFLNCGRGGGLLLSSVPIQTRQLPLSPRLSTLLNNFSSSSAETVHSFFLYLATERSSNSPLLDA